MSFSSAGIRGAVKEADRLMQPFRNAMERVRQRPVPERLVAPELAPPQFAERIIILGAPLQHIIFELEQAGHNPRDARIVKLTNREHAHRVFGLPRATPWSYLGVGHNDYQGSLSALVGQLQHQFGAPMTLRDALGKLDPALYRELKVQG